MIMKLQSETPKVKTVVEQLGINPFDLLAVVGINPNVLEITTTDKEYRIQLPVQDGNPMQVSIYPKGKWWVEPIYKPLVGYTSLMAVFEQVKSDIAAVELIEQ